MSLTTTTTTINCIDPYDFLFRKAKERFDLGLNSSFKDALVFFMGKGLFMNSCNMCCPDCGISMVASIETFLKYAEAVGLTQSAPLPESPIFEAVEKTFENNGNCCINIKASVETWLKYAEAIGLTQSADVPPASPTPFSVDSSQIDFSIKFGCCDTGFNDCVDKLIGIATENCLTTEIFTDRFLDKGVIDFGTINGRSSFCYLVDAIEKYAGDLGCYAEFMDVIADVGITISCIDDIMFIGGVETWLVYYSYLELDPIV